MGTTNNPAGTSASKAPFGRRVRARAMRLLNVPMRVVLGWPFATPLGGRLMLVLIIGERLPRPTANR